MMKQKRGEAQTRHSLSQSTMAERKPSLRHLVACTRTFMDTATLALLRNIEREYPSCGAYAYCNATGIMANVACIGKRMLEFCGVHQEDDDEEHDLIPDLVDVDDDDGVTSTSTALFNDARVRNRYGFILHGSLRQFTLDHHRPSDLSSQAEVRAAWLPPHQIPRLVAVGMPASEPA